MNDSRDVLPIDRLVGRTVLSLASGNRLGSVRDVFVDPINGVITGLAVATEEGEAALPYREVHSFGGDAVMARGDDLGDRRVELGGDDVALGDARVDAHARPGGQAQKRDPAWRLNIQAHKFWGGA